MTSPTVVFNSVSKWYGEVIGINQVSVEFGSGVTGLLGPNGAGKSTMLKVMTGQLRPSSGRVELFGMPPWNNPKVFRRLGYCPDTEGVYADMSAMDFAVMMGMLSGFGMFESMKRARQRLEMLGLGDHALRRLGSYSKGMRQRAKLAVALMHEPDVIVLDEPLNGLDPMGRRMMLDLMRQLGEEGRTVIVSSHILHEVEALTKNVVLIHHGRILANGHIEEIRSMIENQPLTLLVRTPQPRTLGSALAALPCVNTLEFREDKGLVIRTSEPERAYEAIQACVLEKGIDVNVLHPLDENLDAVFQYLVKE